jgi:hypothetical protein
MVTVSGTVVDANARARSEPLRLELWLGRGPAPRDTTYVGQSGYFRLRLDEPVDADELRFRIFDANERLPLQERLARRCTSTAIHVTLETDTSVHPEGLVIESLADLRQKETEVLERVNTLPNGAWLFFLNPLRALNDAGVRLSDVGLREFFDYFEHAGRAGRQVYAGVRAAQGEQNCRVRLRRLFKPVRLVGEGDS